MALILNSALTALRSLLCFAKYMAILFFSSKICINEMISTAIRTLFADKSIIAWSDSVTCWLNRKKIIKGYLHELQTLRNF
jgi:hypothetical protein